MAKKRIRSNSSKLVKKRSKKPININKLIRELKKLNSQTNLLRSNINRNSRKISNIIQKLTKKKRN